MNTLMILVLTKILDYVIPVLVAGVVSYLGWLFNTYLKKKLLLISNNVEYQKAINNLEITTEQQKFIKDKAIDVLKLVEEKSFQAWKDNDKPELTSEQKKDLAIQILTDNVKNVVSSALVPQIPNIIEMVLPQQRGILDNLYNDLKKDYVNLNGQPNNSRPPKQ